VPKRDPHSVLGVDRGASQATIKAAWRRLAREHHPDLTVGDPAAARVATRRMAEINQAYEQLRIGSPGRTDRDAEPKRGGLPTERPTRPVTGRVDTSSTFRPRNMTTGPSLRHAAPAPLRVNRLDREPPRASTPTGPLARGHRRGYKPPEPPSLEDAVARIVEFGKFHGHSLGQIAGFEPSYIDWLAKTIQRDPELLAAARVVQEDLDRRSVPRHPRPVPV
jgi:curved DNA-binding protein CbpA